MKEARLPKKLLALLKNLKNEQYATQQHFINALNAIADSQLIMEWKNTKRDSTHMKYFKTFEDLHDSGITTFKTYLQDTSKALCVMKKRREEFVIIA